MESQMLAPEELQSRFRSKMDLYKLLTYDLGVYLPSYDRCPLHFLRMVLDGRKKVLKTEEITSLAVPKYAELSIKKMWSFVSECEILTEYFPDYDDHQLSERSFLFGVLSTLKPDEMKTLIKNARKKRAAGKSDLDEDLIAIAPSIKEEIWQLLPQKTTRGRAHHLLKQGAKLKKTRAIPRIHDIDLSILNRSQLDNDANFNNIADFLTPERKKREEFEEEKYE